MNVMEDVLSKKIDPTLTMGNLSILASKALGKDVVALTKNILLGGCWNRVIGITLDSGAPELVVKISPDSCDPGILREFKTLSYFTTSTDFPVPQPYLLDDSLEIVPGTVLIMEKLPGKVLHQIYHLLTPQMLQSITEQTAHFVSELHSMHSRGFGAIEMSDERRQAQWEDFWLPRFDKVIKEVMDSGVEDRHFMNDVETARRDFPLYLKIGAQGTLLHYDIWAGNVIITFHKNRCIVSGFIDVQGYWGDYARELSFMELFGLATPLFYSLYKNFHTLDSHFELRKNIYNLKMNLKHITMYPNESFYRMGARNCLRAIK